MLQTGEGLKDFGVYQAGRGLMIDTIEVHRGKRRSPCFGSLTLIRDQDICINSVT